MPHQLPNSVAISPTTNAEFKVEYNLRAVLKVSLGERSAEISESQVFRVKSSVDFVRFGFVQRQNLPLEFSYDVGGF